MLKLPYFLCFFSFMGLLFAKGEQVTPSIAMIAKGEQTNFWQQLRLGAFAAAEELGVELSFQAPPTENDVQMQAEMLSNVIAQKPDAIALAALLTPSILEQLEQTLTENIPVIFFDSSGSNAPEGAILAHVTTDNYKIGALAAEKMFEQIVDRLNLVTEESPATLVVLSQDALSPAVINRARGFVKRMLELISKLENISKDDINVLGNPIFIEYHNPKRGKKVFINHLVAFKATIAEVKTSALALLNEYKKNNILGVFASSELAANALIEVSANGSELPFYGLVIVGFDAGKAQKDAVRAGYFLGSVTQDPYAMGYQALETAYKAYKGEAVTNLYTAAHFYNSENMDEPSMQALLYD